MVKPSLTDDVMAIAEEFATARARTYLPARVPSDYAAEADAKRRLRDRITQIEMEERRPEICQALCDLAFDKIIGKRPSVLRVYQWLATERPELYKSPQEVKRWAIAKNLRVKEDTVKQSLDILISRGYIIEHGRGLSQVRLLSLPLERVDPAINPHPKQGTIAA